MSEYFPEPKPFGRRVKVEWDLPNYATKADLRKATGVDTSKFAKRIDLASLISDVDKLDIDKLKSVPIGLNSLKSKVNKLVVDELVPIPVYLSKLTVDLSDVVKMMLLKKKKNVYNAKVKDFENKIPDITNLTTNTTLNSKINEDKKEIPSITNLVTNASLNAKINVIKEIPSITNLATTTTALTGVKNKISNFSNLVQKNLL